MNQLEADYCLSCDVKRRGEGSQKLMSNDVKLEVPPRRISDFAIKSLSSRRVFRVDLPTD